MTRCGLVLASCLLGTLPLLVCGFSSASSGTLKRSFGSRVSLTSSPLRVTVTFANRADHQLQGFFFSEQLPSALTVTTLAVTLNGRPVTNFLFEAGQPGDVLPGCIPWRWGLETPTNFAEANPIEGQGTAQIVYALSCSSTGSFQLPHFSWAATETGLTNNYFGFNEELDQPLVRFVAQTNLPLLFCRSTAENFTLTVDGVPGTIYLLSASTNLATWIPVATNLSPFVFVETNWAAFPRRFYHASPCQSLSATIHLALGSPEGRLVQVSGVASLSYLLERSTNLLNWAPLATNVVPFSFFDTNTAGLPACFYRGRLLYEP